MPHLLSDGGIKCYPCPFSPVLSCLFVCPHIWFPFYNLSLTQPNYTLCLIPQNTDQGNKLGSFMNYAPL